MVLKSVPFASLMARSRKFVIVARNVQTVLMPNVKPVLMQTSQNAQILIHAMVVVFGFRKQSMIIFHFAKIVQPNGENASMIIATKFFNEMQQMLRCRGIISNAPTVSPNHLCLNHHQPQLDPPML
jgi:hypothetical protein